MMKSPRRWAGAVALCAMPTSQNRDMGHPHPAPGAMPTSQDRESGHLIVVKMGHPDWGREQILWGRR